MVQLPPQADLVPSMHAFLVRQSIAAMLTCQHQTSHAEAIGRVQFSLTDPEPQAVEGDSDGGLEWLDAEEPASQLQPDAQQLPRASATPPSELQAKQSGQIHSDAGQAGQAPPDDARKGTSAPGAAAAAPPAAAAGSGPASAAGEASPAKKRGAPRRRRVRVVPKDEGDVEGFDFAVPLQRKQPPASAAEAEGLAAAAGAASEAAAAAAPALEPVADTDGMLSPKHEADVAVAAEAATPFGSPAAQQQVQPEQQQQQQQRQPKQSASQPAATPAEVRDTDDWGVEIVDAAAADAAGPAEPDSGGRVAAAAVAEATNNARGGAGTH